MTRALPKVERIGPVATVPKPSGHNTSLILQKLVANHYATWKNVGPELSAQGVSKCPFDAFAWHFRTIVEFLGIAQAKFTPCTDEGEPQGPRATMKKVKEFAQEVGGPAVLREYLDLLEELRK